MIDDIDSLVAEYAGVITRAVRRVAGARSGDVEDDVRQVVLVGLWRQLERGQTIDRPASYIFRAAVRETLHLLRRERRRATESPVDPDQTASHWAAHDPHRVLEDQERARALMASIDALAPKRRLAVRAHLSGYDVREVMEMYGWSYQTARHQIARGMADLRALLRQRGHHE